MTETQPPQIQVKKYKKRKNKKTNNTNTENENENTEQKSKVVLTIDVGLKNLAMCIMDNQYRIHLWDVYNILENEENEQKYKCNGIIKSTNKPCHYKCQYYFPKLEQENLNSTEWVSSCKTHFPKSMKELEKKYIIKQKKVKDYLLQTVAEKIMKSIDTIYNTKKELFDTLTHICIELQPKVNQRMKFTSHIIYAKFVDLYKHYQPIVPIRFIRASQNLQAYKGPFIECKLKSPYAKRKYLSVAYVKWYLESSILNNEFNNHQKLLDKLLTHSKKDDLCDVVNSNLNVHNGLSQKQKRNKNGSEIK